MSAVYCARLIPLREASSAAVATMPPTAKARPTMDSRQIRVTFAQKIEDPETGRLIMKYPRWPYRVFQ